MAIVDPTGMIDDGIKTDTVNWDAGLDGGVYFLANVTKPLAARTALSAGFSDENGMAIPGIHFTKDVAEGAIECAGAWQRGKLPDTADAFQKLLDDKTFLHTGKKPKERIKDQREVSYFDPDVDRIMVIVEVKTLLLDNLASLSQREPFIPLYTTFRKFPDNPEDAFALQLEYRDANVIQFGNKIDLGDLNLSQTDIDNGDSIVLPEPPQP